MTLGWVILLAILAVLIAPWIIYQCVKLGTYAWFQGRFLFEREHRDEPDSQEDK